MDLERIENHREIFYLIECIYYHEQNVGRNINVKGNSGEVSEEMMNKLLDRREKATLVINQQELCLIIFYC